jgi:hypothetical protein
MEMGGISTYQLQSRQMYGWEGTNAICHEMLIDKYTFFLDEMILRRNCMTREKLTNEKQSPSNWLHSSE